MIETSRAVRRLVGLALRFSIPAFALVATVATTATGYSSQAPEDDEANADTQALSTTIHTDYGVTTFGGPGDYQKMACGDNSATSQEWYVASSQRYGCHVHLQLTANGKCVVVQTEDAGPATFVETDAHMAILDSSPAVGRYFFGTSGLGWSDVRNHPGKYQVHAVVTKLPLGPCSTTPAPTPTPGPTPTPVPMPSPVSPPTVDAGPPVTVDSGTSSGSGTSCHNDGQCNPGSDGSGMICTSGECVDGCNANWQCPGRTTCQSGMCQ